MANVRRRACSAPAASLLVAAALPLLVACGPVARSPRPEVTGRLAGQVRYVGLPCGPAVERRVPPCSGPLAGFEIVILEADSRRESMRLRSGDDGRFLAVLPAGEFLIEVPAGASGVRTTRFTIDASQETRLALDVDTGVR